MTVWAVRIGLGVLCLSAWISGIALLRARTALDRLHCASFLSLVGGLALTVAVFCAEGPTLRAFKTLFIWILASSFGAVATHALGRAIHLRDGGVER